jgi:DNA-binding transcriptional regulator YdaS (Cro superfamily)
MDESKDTPQLTPQQALSLAVNRLKGQSAMARLCEVAQSTVWEWLDRDKPLPAEHVLKVEAATGVSRHDLRPDIYPRGLQDGVPFRDDPLEGPLAPSPDDRSCEASEESQPKADAA